MLSISDAEAIRAWLPAALQSAEPRGVTKASLAAACGVTVQAVDGWLRTGRITKSNLKKAEALLGSEPNFMSGTPVAAERTAEYNVSWPFKLVSRVELAALPKRRLDRLDQMLRDRLNEWAEDDAASKRKAA